MASNYVKMKLPTNREVYLNKNNVTVISQDPMAPETKTEVYMADGIRYLFAIKLEDILKLLDNTNSK